MCVLGIPVMVQTIFNYADLLHINPCSKDLLECLDKITANSRTSKLWIECLVKPVLIMSSYVSAERESDWALHLSCLKQMLPLFFSAGHFNYARSALYYLRSMEALPREITDRFLAGEHTMHHQCGIRNGIWSNMAIETTYMRYGHEKGGIIGLTQHPETLKVWAYSRHACNEMVNAMNGMRDDQEAAVMFHKEEKKVRMTNDGKDRQALRDKLLITIDPLNPRDHPGSEVKGFINVVSGQVIEASAVNVDCSISIGQSQMDEFEASWPDGFHNPISRKVKTLASPKLHQPGEKTLDPEIMYGRAMALKSVRGRVDDKKLLSHEMSPYPLSIFEKNGHLREATNKSMLKKSPSSRGFYQH